MKKPRIVLRHSIAVILSNLRRSMSEFCKVVLLRMIMPTIPKNQITLLTLGMYRDILNVPNST